RRTRQAPADRRERASGTVGFAFLLPPGRSVSAARPYGAHRSPRRPRATRRARGPAFHRTPADLYYHCFGCGPGRPFGLRVRSFRDDRGVSPSIVSRQYGGPPGTAHGGIVATAPGRARPAADHGRSADGGGRSEEFSSSPVLATARGGVVLITSRSRTWT